MMFRRLVALVFVVLLLTSCGSPQFAKSDAARQALENKLAEITADSVVTMAEWTEYQEVARAYYDALEEDAKGVDWVTTGVTIATAVIAAFTGTNVYRNKRETKVWGPRPTPVPPPTTT